MSRTLAICSVTVAMLLPTLCLGQARASARRATPTVTGPGYVWWEGENTVETSLGPKGRWTVAEGPGFSGGKVARFSANATPPEGVTATWKIDVPQAGTYDLWARIGYRPWCAHEWQMDDGKWTESGRDFGFYQFIKPPLNKGVTEACWITYGRLKLAAGQHTFRVRFKMPAGRKHILQNFDCFILTTQPFVPLGKFRPDENIPANPMPKAQLKNPPVPVPDASKGWWAFHPVYPPDQKRVMDMSFLNEPVGTHGFVTMKDGELYFQDETPVRFWGINAGYWGGRMVYQEHVDADRWAEHLAQMGVNCVRLHILHSANSLIDKTRDDTQHFDAKKLDRLDYLAAALHKRGIYVNLDLNFHRTFGPGDEIEDELVVVGNQKRRGNYNVSWACGAAAHFHPRAVELNIALYKKLMTHVNPYTKKRWADNPGMAMCTIQNEQSIFWGTTNVLKGKTRAILDKLHTAWLQKTYGTNAKLLAAWQVKGQPSPLDAKKGENLDTGVVELGRVVMSPAGPRRKRAADQIQFLWHVETSFYKRFIGAMRSWGVKCPIITSNWRGSGQTTRLVIQASALGEIVDRHSYFTRPEPMTAAVGKGLPRMGFDQVAGRAFCLSEWNHGAQGFYVPETVPLMATVAALQGWDALFHFAPASPTWQTHLGGLNVTPGHYAMYPMAAVIFRRGDIRPGPVVYERRRDPAYQFGFAREPAKVTDDPNANLFADKTTGVVDRVPTELLAIGRVQNAYVDKPAPDLLRKDLVEKCWDPKSGVVTSATGEVEWNYKKLRVRLNSKRTQGAFGALKGAKITCDDVTIRTPNEYCTILVTSLESKPIPQSGRLLVAAMGRMQNNGVAPGSKQWQPPCLVEPVTGTVSVRTKASKVYAVTAAGYRVGEVRATSAGGRLTFPLEGKPQVLYYEITD